MPRYAVKAVIFIDEDDPGDAMTSVRNLLTTSGLKDMADDGADFAVIGAEPLVEE